MRVAGDLLASATTPYGLAALLRAVQLATGEFAPLDPEPQSALGLDGDARMAAGAGDIRVLVLRIPGDAPFREQVQRAAARLSSRAPHVHWIVGALSGTRSSLIAWTRGERSQRVAIFGWEPHAVVGSDAETICALAGAASAGDALVHARVVDVLGRESLTRRFYRTLEARVTGLAGAAPVREAEGRAVALLCVSRLLFLCFLEAKGWLNGERAFLSSRFDDCMATGGSFHRRVLLPLFFGTLNTPPRRRAAAARALGRVPFLNGGLFARTLLERSAGRWHFPDEQLGLLFSGLLQRYRFVAREDSATWSEASVDPEMLGRAFESLMSAPERRAGGVFFTPHPLVARVADEALWSLGTEPCALKGVRVLDPACGSGAFLVYALERIAELRAASGEQGTMSAIRRDVLARSIFGVDRNPTAVWLCELRLWLSVVIDLDEADPLRVPPLPNLDRNIRVGDALAGAAFTEPAPGSGRRVRELRARYVRATGRRKGALGRALDREERRRSVARLDREIERLVHARREQLVALRSRDLFGERAVGFPTAERARLRVQLRAARAERRRLALGGALPFSFSALFAEAHAAGGFDLVIGNPPWVRLHNIPDQLRARFRESFEVYRGAAWQSGARRAGAAKGFASQVDMAALFVERAVRLLRAGGTLSFLVPVKLWQSLAGGGVRRMLAQETDLTRVEDLSGTRHAFEAAVYPSLIVSRVGVPPGESLAVARTDANGFREWRVARDALPLDATPGAPWLLLEPGARAAFDRVRDAGVPLADSVFGQPRLGVKSGCNAAFVVRLVERGARLATVEDADGERGKVEAALLRPTLRGDSLRAWTRLPGDEVILWTHDARGPLADLPPAARQWLQRRYGQLTRRADAGRSRRWWALFRVDAAECRRPRVAWADFGKRPRAMVIPAGDPVVPLNTCYVVHAPTEGDAWALCAILNSRLAAAWLNAIAEVARGGYRRYLGWTVGQLPLPRDWSRARHDLGAAAARAASGAHEDALTTAVLRAYGIGDPEAAMLLGTCDT